MEKLYEMHWDSEDASFNYYDGMIVSGIEGIERWKKEVKKKVHKNLKRNLIKYHEDKDNFEDAADLSFDGWIDWCLENWAYMEDIEIENYDD